MLGFWGGSGRKSGGWEEQRLGRAEERESGRGIAQRSKVGLSSALALLRRVESEVGSILMKQTPGER